VPFYVGAASVLAAIAVLSTGRRLLRVAERNQAAELPAAEHECDVDEIAALSEMLSSAT
jgi:hypothetical protein